MSSMQLKTVTPTIRDLGNVIETFVNGPINLTVNGNVALITCTTVRPNLDQAFKGQIKDFDAVVSARLALSIETLLQLRELLNKSVLPQPIQAAPTLQQ